MDKKKTISVITAVIALLIILYYLRSRRPEVLAAPSTGSFDAPYTEWPNGIYPTPENMNGSETPFGDINVNVTVPTINGLSNDYIPVFGFTGVVAVG